MKPRPTGPTVVDLFAGCGGMTAGFVAEGFTPVLAVEWEHAAAATYAANFGADHMRWTDIAKASSGDVPKADVVIGGPPVPGVLKPRHQGPGRPTQQALEGVVRVVVAADPQVLVIENVDRFAKSPEFAVLIGQLTRGRLRRWRHFDHGVLNAADYGVPQRRRRTILIASRVGEIALPRPTHAKDPSGDLKAWTTVRSAIGEVPEAPVGTELPSSTEQFFGERVAGIFKSEQIHVGRRPRPTGRGSVPRREVAEREVGRVPPPRAERHRGPPRPQARPALSRPAADNNLVKRVRRAAFGFRNWTNWRFGSERGVKGPGRGTGALRI